MATDIKGSTGSITFTDGEIAARLENWSASFDNTVVEYRPFDAAPFPVRHVTGISLSGSATGVIQFDDTTTAPFKTSLTSTGVLTEANMNDVALVLTATTGCTYGFNAALDGVSITRPSDGRAEITVNFSSTGAITQTWDETA